VRSIDNTVNRMLEDEGDEEFDPREFVLRSNESDMPSFLQQHGFVPSKDNSDRWSFWHKYTRDHYLPVTFENMYWVLKPHRRVPASPAGWVIEKNRYGLKDIISYLKALPDLEMEIEEAAVPVPPEATGTDPEGDEEFNPRDYVVNDSNMELALKALGFGKVEGHNIWLKFSDAVLHRVEEHDGQWHYTRHQGGMSLGGRRGSSDRVLDAIKACLNESAEIPVADPDGDEEFSPRDYVVDNSGELIDYIESVGFKRSETSFIGDLWSYSPVRDTFYTVIHSKLSGLWSLSLAYGYRTPVRGFKTRTSWKHKGSADDILAKAKAIFKKPTHESEEEGDEEFNPRDYVVGRGYGEYSEAMSYVHASKLNIWGSVMRNSSHYVHERSTDFDMTWEWDFDRDEFEDEEEEMAIQNRVDAQLSNLHDGIAGEIVNWNHKIYRELEAAYDWLVSEEVVADNIMANGVLFDEDGGQDGDCEFTYDQLSDAAKRTARESWVEDSVRDNDYADNVVSEWKWLLAQKGFDDVEINWSGFWSQGDGASFTAKSFDIERYFEGQDPLTFPEQERQQLNEAAEPAPAEEGDEEFNPRDYVVAKPVRQDRNRLSDLPIAKQLVIECEGRLYTGERTTIGAWKNFQHVWRLLVWIEGNPVMLDISSVHKNDDGTYRVRTRRRDGSQVEVELDEDEPVVSVDGHPDPFRNWKADISAVDIVPSRYPVREAEGLDAEGDEEFNPRDFVVSPDRSIMARATDLSDDIWGNEAKLKRAFSWLTKIGLAPKFGTVPIHYYQQEQIAAIDKLKALAAAKGIQMQWVRYKKGNVYVYDARQWHPLAHVYNGEATPLAESEVVEPEGDEEFDPREYFVSGNKLWFEVDGKPMSWDYEREQIKNIPLYGGAATLRLQYGIVNIGPKWWINIDASLPWEGKTNIKDIAHIESVTGADETKVQKLIAKALARADVWWDSARWGFDLYAEFNDYQPRGWFEFTASNRDLPTSYDNQTPESCAAWRQLKAQFEREHPVTESAEKGLNPFEQPKMSATADIAFEAWLGEKSGFGRVGDGRWMRQEGDIKSVVENNGDGFYRFTVYERCRQKSHMVLTAADLAPRMEALTLL